MKGLKTLLGITLATVGFGGAIAVGVSAVTSANNRANIVEAEEQEITDSTIEIRFTRPSDWGNNTVCIHTWNEGGSGTTWPGNAMTYLWDNEFGQSVWSWSPSSGTPLYSKIIFNNNNNGMQSANLDAPSSSRAYYYDNGWVNAEIPTMDIYLYDYDNKFGSGTARVHAWRDDTDFANDTFPGNAMTKLSSIATNGLIYKFTMNNRYNRVQFSSAGDSDKTGTLTPSGNYCYVLANDETVLSGKNTWWDNINYVFAHNFAQNTMLMRSIPTSDESSTVYCSDRYDAAKTHFNALMASGYKTYVLEQLNDNFSDAMARLDAWADANGESLDTTAGTLGTRTMINPINIATNNIYIVVLFITVISLTAVGGYFIIRRKKHQ